ncbi:hypothetical protein [Kitasatospora griseola]|uniref:hypothetical protein n=1 Tax=Kitasatospora griseola TaxID=2064 RepID=UPI00365304E8
MAAAPVAPVPLVAVIRVSDVRAAPVVGAVAAVSVALAAPAVRVLFASPPSRCAQPPSPGSLAVFQASSQSMP